MTKRMFDIIISLLGLVVMSPLLIIIGLSIKVCMGSPIFFKQQRIGLHGDLFWIWKFRTMMGRHSGSNISVAGDPRVTPIGLHLRRYKLDELPELWNVLRGDMSFVGPRPDIPAYLDAMTGEYRRILKLRPGITGPASLKYAREEELLATVTDPKKYNEEVIYPDKLRINLHYYFHRNLLIDLQIIIQTIFRRYPRL